MEAGLPALRGGLQLRDGDGDGGAPAGAAGPSASRREARDPPRERAGLQLAGADELLAAGPQLGDWRPVDDVLRAVQKLEAALGRLDQDGAATRKLVEELRRQAEWCHSHPSYAELATEDKEALQEILLTFGSHPPGLSSPRFEEGEMGLLQAIDPNTFALWKGMSLHEYETAAGGLGRTDA